MLFDRFRAQSLKSSKASFSAPKKGWVKNESLLEPQQGAAEVLDNVFPTAQGGRLRKGCEKHATIGGAVKKMFTWKSGGSELLFAASATDIYDVTTPADVDVAPTASVSSLTNGDWSIANFANSAADYLILANGADSVRAFDGTTWTTPAITGVTSSTLSQVWPFKEKLYFIEGDTLSFWYLATNAIAGAATEFPLKGVFQLGGSLLFGATWSLDSGEGLDDVCVFVTDQGEIAVYIGTDPASASTWSLQGVYRIGVPLNKNAFFKAGGDLAILTEDGIIPLSEALRKDRAALMAVAITFPIEDAWQQAIAGRSSSFPFSVSLWHSQTMLVIGTPSIDGGTDVAFVANARTGAWCRFTGWDIQDSTIHEDSLYFGSADTFIYQGDVTGTDNGTEYAGLWIPKFSEGNPSQKFAVHARFRGRAGETYAVGIAAFSDYEVGSVGSVAAATEESDNVWGAGLWGTMTWGGSEYKQYVSDWQTVTGQGTSLAPAVRIGSNRATEPTLEIIALDLLYNQGEIL